MVVDIDNMGTAMSREENMDTKKVYTYLFHVKITKCTAKNEKQSFNFSY